MSAEIDFYQSDLDKKACQDFSVLGLKRCPATGLLKAGLHQVFGKFCHDFKSASSYTAGPGIDNLISVTQHKGHGRAKSYFYAADALGSVRQVMDSRGRSVNSYNYFPYGMAYNVREQVKLPYRYTGRRWDPNVGKLWYRSRHYAPGVGRFSQADKWGKSIGLFQ